MAKTVDTAAAVYMSAAEAVKRLDDRPFRDYCSDDGTRLTSAALLTNANFLAILRDACGEVEACCFVGGRYRPADLTALAADTGMGAGKLFRLIARLMSVMVYERRLDIQMAEPWIYEQTMNDLQALRDGIEIFGFRETEQAGVVQNTVETAADVETRNGFSYQIHRLLGRRGNRFQ